jgi:DNA-binding response OmpR family regulator
MTIFVVDDDEKILKVLVAYLMKEGYSVETATEGWAAVQQIQERKPDIVVLDLMLPGLDGLGVCREIRRNSNVPIIMLTARDEETDRVIGLEIGADDYVTKPFSPRELLARIRAILRRVKSAKQSAKTETIREWGEVRLDIQSHTLTVAGTAVDVTPTEYKLMELFLEHPGQVFSRLQLIEKVQGYTFEGYERTVDSHIKNLRKKLEESDGEFYYIKTVYGVGYKWAGDPHA